MNEPTETKLGEALSRLVAGVGSPLVRAEEITVLPSARTARRTYRLWFADGRCLKGRRFMSPVLAMVARRIHETAGAPFLPRMVAQDGDAMLEEWIEGEALIAGQVNPAVISECGRMLGVLHACPAPSTADLDFKPLDLDGWAKKLRDNLAQLTDAGILTPSRARQLDDLATSDRPDRLSLGIVHRDLCPENLVQDAHGRLFWVDNGSLVVGAIEEDLCRVWYRWPMGLAEQQAFADGYRRYRDARGFCQPSRFWAIVVVTNSARVRAGNSLSDAVVATHRLDRFLQGVKGDLYANHLTGGSA